MNTVFEKTVKILSKTPIVAVLVVGGVLGYMFKGVVTSAPPAGSREVSERAEAAEEIWTCSMHPEIRLPEPGSCPICGMDLVLAERTATKKKKAGTPLYACSMFCLPPQPNPGQCQICGMDMVEVEVEEDDEASGPRTLTLSANARKLAGVQVAPVERRFVSRRVRMVGKVAYDETRLAYITAWVPGRLDRLYVDYTGIPVRKGDHMVYLYSPDLLTAQAELLEAAKAARELEGGSVGAFRDTALGWVEAIRDKFRLWGLTEAQIAEIERRGTPSDHMTIYAPTGGIVIEKNAVEGMYVETGTRIYAIADFSWVWIMLDAYESDLMWLRYGQEVRFETEAYPGETFTGTISFIDPVLDPKTRTVKVRLNVPNHDGWLKPEMFVRAVVEAKVAAGGRVLDPTLAGKWICPMHPEVVRDGPDDCDVCGMPVVRAEELGYVSVDAAKPEAPLVIPASAPLITGKRAVVYVELDAGGGTYEGREVVLGPRAGDFYLVREGLREGERVVVNGNFKIDSAMQILARPSMMSPQGGGPAPAHHHGEGAPPAESERAAAVPTRRHEVDRDDLEPFDVPGAFRAHLDGVFTVYFRIQGDLSHDRFPGAQRAATGLSQAATEVDMTLLEGDVHHAWMREWDTIQARAAAIVKAADIESARAEFALLSEAMIVVAKRFGVGHHPVYRFHCPMAFDGQGADWLQATNRTENPFFGSAMFRCGTMEESLGSSLREKEAEGAGDE